MRLLLAGGGSGGSAAPVIAVAEAVRERDPSSTFLYIGTTSGPEAALVQAAELPYVSIHAGRLRRYATWRNLTDPALVLVGLAQAMRHVATFRPQVAFAAGGFATVPPLLAARLLGVPIVIHQQDAVPGLANKMLAPFATQVTVAFEESASQFKGRRVVAVGNPVRRGVLAGDGERTRLAFGIPPGLPVILVTGGGTGALRLNRIANAAARELVEEAFVVHLTGTGKAQPGWEHPRYQQHEFLTTTMADVLALADVVVTRAGMSALTELAALGKPAIIVPMPHSHQEENARIFASAGAGIVLNEGELSPKALANAVRLLLRDREHAAALSRAAGSLLSGDSATTIARLLLAVAAG